MFKRAVTLTVLIVARRLPGAAGAAERWSRARSRLGARHRHEPVGRLRLRQARRRLPRHPRPLLHATRSSGRVTQRRRARAAAAEPLDDLVPPRDTGRRPRPRPRTRSTRRRATATTSCCAARSGRELETFDGRDARRRRRARAAARTRGQRRARRPVPRRARDPHGVAGSGLNAINALGLESYLLGVVPAARARRHGPPPRSRRRPSRRAPTRSRRT